MGYRNPYVSKTPSTSNNLDTEDCNINNLQTPFDYDAEKSYLYDRIFPNMEEQVYLQLQPHSETIAAIMRIHTHIFYLRSDQCNIF